MIHKELIQYLHNLRGPGRPPRLVFYADGRGRVEQEGRQIVGFDTLEELTALVRHDSYIELERNIDEAERALAALKNQKQRLCYSEPVPQPEV